MRKEALYRMYASHVQQSMILKPEESQYIMEQQTVMLDLRLQKWMILWIILRIIASLQNLIRRLAGDSSVLRKYLAKAAHVHKGRSG